MSLTCATPPFKRAASVPIWRSHLWFVGVGRIGKPSAELDIAPCAPIFRYCRGGRRAVNAQPMTGCLGAVDRIGQKVALPIRERKLDQKSVLRRGEPRSSFPTNRLQLPRSTLPPTSSDANCQPNVLSRQVQHTLRLGADPANSMQPEPGARLLVKRKQKSYKAVAARRQHQFSYERPPTASPSFVRHSGARTELSHRVRLERERPLTRSSLCRAERYEAMD